MNPLNLLGLHLRRHVGVAPVVSGVGSARPAHRVLTPFRSRFWPTRRSVLDGLAPHSQGLPLQPLPEGP